MKKVIILALVVVFVLAATTSFAAIANTRHNLTVGGLFATKTTVTSQTLCGFCHVPHGGSTSVALAPLWARKLATDAGYPISSYQPYGSATAGSAGTTMSGTSVPAVPGALSLVCLSCHDGTWGMGVITKNGQDTADQTFAGNVVGGSSRLDFGAFAGAYNPVIGGAGGQDLQNDHPVGLVYDSTATLAGLTANIVTVGSQYFVETSGRQYPVFGGTGDGSSTLECASCHDPHVEDVSFLRNAAPASLCEDCHATK